MGWVSWIPNDSLWYKLRSALFWIITSKLLFVSASTPSFSVNYWYTCVFKFLRRSLSLSPQVLVSSNFTSCTNNSLCFCVSFKLFLLIWWCCIFLLKLHCRFGNFDVEFSLRWSELRPVKFQSVLGKRPNISLALCSEFQDFKWLFMCPTYQSQYQ